MTHIPSRLNANCIGESLFTNTLCPCEFHFEIRNKRKNLSSKPLQAKLAQASIIKPLPSKIVESSTENAEGPIFSKKSGHLKSPPSPKKNKNNNPVHPSFVPTNVKKVAVKTRIVSDKEFDLDTESFVSKRPADKPNYFIKPAEPLPEVPLAPLPSGVSQLSPALLPSFLQGAPPAPLTLEVPVPLVSKVPLPPPVQLASKALLSPPVPFVSKGPLPQPILNSSLVNLPAPSTLAPPTPALSIPQAPPVPPVRISSAKSPSLASTATLAVMIQEKVKKRNEREKNNPPSSLTQPKANPPISPSGLSTIVPSTPSGLSTTVPSGLSTPAKKKYLPQGLLVRTRKISTNKKTNSAFNK